MTKPSPAEVLRFISAEEPLERTLRRFPSVSREDLQALLDAVAEAATAREASLSRPARSPADAPAAPSPKGGSSLQPRPSAAASARAPKSLRVYSDGAARGNPGPAGAGAVLMTTDGEIVERLGRYLGRNTNNYAEYMGLIMGLQRAHDLGAGEVEVFADSELMVRQLSGRYQVKAPNLKPLFDEAMALLRRFDRVKLHHIRRELNLDADEMSNRAIDERM